MEAIGVPWFIIVRHLGPPLFLLVVGGVLLLRRAPKRRGLAWAALVTNLTGAALPFLWLGLQALTGYGDLTLYGFIMTFLQPGVVVLAWLLLLWALVAPSPAATAIDDGIDPEGEEQVKEVAGDKTGEEAQRAAENVG